MSKLYSKVYMRLLTAFFLFLTPFAIWAKPTPFSNIVFFGDSLSDNGNLYASDRGIMPESPPYFEGRFSNGYVWSEYVANYYQNQNNISSINYAVGGATTVLHNPFNGYLPWTLTEEVDGYLLKNRSSDKSKILFVIWIGANDYFNGAKDVDEATNDVIDGIKSSIDKLIKHGAKTFLIINLPNLAKTPYGLESDHLISLNLDALSLTHNQKLALAVDKVNKENKDINIHLFDLGALFDDVLANTAYYNQKYNVNITDITTGCWQGGYRVKDNKALDETVIENHLMKNPLLKKKDGQLDIKAFSSFVAQSPDLREAYLVEMQASEGEQPCDNPDNHIFWDHVHPTAVVHRILSENILEYVKTNYPQVVA